MAWLTMSPGRKVKVGLSFEHPDDQFVEMAANPETRAQIAQGLSSADVTDDIMDKQMGIESTPLAQMSIITKHAIGHDTVVFMTKDELRRHAYECMAMVKAMDKFSSLVDDTMSEYRKKVRERTVRGDES